MAGLGLIVRFADVRNFPRHAGLEPVSLGPPEGSCGCRDARLGLGGAYPVTSSADRGELFRPLRPQCIFPPQELQHIVITADAILIGDEICQFIALTADCRQMRQLGLHHMTLLARDR
jgi:hypothetical protein